MKRSHLSLMSAAAIALIAATTAPAAAIPPSWDWVWAVNRLPSAGATNLGPKDGGSSSGGTVVITRISVGSYEVRASGIGTVAGVAVVTPLGSEERICNVTQWGSAGSDLSAKVACWTRAGDSADSGFAFNWYQVSGTMGSPSMAYLWDNLPGNASFSPSLYAYNSMGGSLAVSRASEGQHTIRMGTMGYAGGTVLIGAYGGTPAVCAANEWSIDGDDEVASVSCRDLAGVPLDQRFSFAFINNQGLKAYDSPKVYLWANNPGAARYSPMAAYRYSSPGTGMRIERSSRGTYTVQLRDQTDAIEYGGSVQLTATGDGTKHCQLTSIARKKTSVPMRIGVRCYGTNGRPADSRFTLVWAR